VESVVTMMSGLSRRARSGLKRRSIVHGQPRPPAGAPLRAVPEPGDGGRSEISEDLPGDPDGLVRLLDRAIGAVDARQVAETAVPAEEERPAAQGRLDRDEPVEAVHEHPLTADALRRNGPLEAPFATRVRAGSAGEGEAPARVEAIAVADKLEGRLRRVGASQEPGKIRRRVPRCGSSGSCMRVR
jgi:hypothetical protein